MATMLQHALRSQSRRLSSSVHPTAVILEHVSLGSGCSIGANSIVGPHVAMGMGCAIGPNAVIQNAQLGANVVVHPGTCIGQDGFGFEVGKDAHAKKPQTLSVVIEDEVEIGANCTIDRGSWRNTTIGRGTKMDNLIQIGHNVIIGKHCLIAAQTGIAGSTEIGDFVLIGGQVGIAQHLKIGTKAQIAAKSGVMSNIAPGTRVGGVPAVPIQQFHRQTLIVRNLAARNNTTPSSQEN